MSSKDFAQSLQDSLKQLKASGTAAVYCDNLIAYLQDFLDSPHLDPSPAEIERFKADMQSRSDYQKLEHERRLAMFQSVISAGQNAIKFSLLLNGGAAVALLGFIANISRSSAAQVGPLASTIEPFAYGSLAIVVTSGLTYLGQLLFSEDKLVIGRWVQLLCIVVGISSYMCFVWGIWRVSSALTGFLPRSC